MNASARKILWLACMFLTACNRIHEHKAESLASQANVGVVEQGPGTTPFIRKLTLSLAHFADLQSVAYTIAPRPGTVSRPVAVTFERSWLERDGDYNNFYRRLTLPVFGLYANHTNKVTLTLTFRDGSTQVQPVELPTPAYTDPPAAIYGNPTVRTARSPGAAPGVDFIAIHNGVTTPVVIDTDGNLRWVGRGVPGSVAASFAGTGFYVGSLDSTAFTKVNLDGTWLPGTLGSSRYTNFHHDLSPGKRGFLAEFDAQDNGVKKVESVLAEISPTGEVLKEWDMGAIFRQYMQAHGDNPANFVRDGADWFHMNSAIYSPGDDSLIVSSRENFVAKLDYETGALKWLLGDTTKHWYVNFPSLRALALTLTAGKAPIGQHSLSLTANGQLLLFNNGWGSLSQPLGTPPGETRTYSTPSQYAIDEQARTAAEVWTYDHDRSLYSDICSSAYETTPGNYLLAYSVANQRTRARIIGVDASGKVAFDVEYPTNLCGTVFLATPIGFGALSLK